MLHGTISALLFLCRNIMLGNAEVAAPICFILVRMILHEVFLHGPRIVGVAQHRLHPVSADPLAQAEWRDRGAGPFHSDRRAKPAERALPPVSGCDR
jgi:hypothetical protein